ncbi:MAG: Gfo/Idh/MocA family oxidoreductase, partial [Pirellulales bacterium]|nr:Gfo/Idh/MocA family oxidoreductase [Pirellulales bacterium]
MAMGFGIIGCGVIADFHARAIADIGGARLVACHDTVPAAANRLAEATGCHAYHDLDEMLADPALDVVTIGTPSGTHMESAVAAARAGKHVIVEKPLEITLRRCDRIIEACQKAGVVLSTIFPSRFHAASAEMKKAIDQGRFGRLVGGDAYVKWYRSQQYYDSGAWRGTWELDGGGALMNQAIH